MLRVRPFEIEDRREDRVLRPALHDGPLVGAQRQALLGKRKAGDQVTVTLQPVKNGAPVGRLRKVVLANGETLGTTLPGAAPAPAQQPGR